jgi:hypothetical protein
MIPKVVSIKHLKAMRKACRRLLRWYLREKDLSIRYSSCPLCVVADPTESQHCLDSCPWGWFTGMSCSVVYDRLRTHAWEKGDHWPWGVAVARTYLLPFWVGRRIPELKEWILKIRVEIWWRRLRWILREATEVPKEEN